MPLLPLTGLSALNIRVVDGVDNQKNDSKPGLYALLSVADTGCGMG